MDHGKIIVSGTSSDLKKSLKGDTITLKLRNDNEFKAVQDFKDAIEVKKMELGDIRIKVSNSDTVLPELMKYLSDHKISPQSINVRKPSLDEVFIEYTGRNINAEQSGKDYGKLMAMDRRAQ